MERLSTALEQLYMGKKVKVTALCELSGRHGNRLSRLSSDEPLAESRLGLCRFGLGRSHDGIWLNTANNDNTSLYSHYSDKKMPKLD